MRFGQSPNKREQDGIKAYWLCADCENRFSDFEREFANNIFYPFMNGEGSSFRYGPWFLKFAVSLSWRVLGYWYEEAILDHFPDDLLKNSKTALETWRKFFLDEVPHPGPFQQHIFPLGALEHYTGQDLPPNINRYVLRSVDLDCACTSKEAFVYAKLPSILFIGFIHIPKPNQWKGTKVHVKSGMFGTASQTVPMQLGDFLKSKAALAGKIYTSMSERQVDKLSKDFMKDLDKAAASESFKALDADVRLFGDKAFLKKEDDSDS